MNTLQALTCTAILGTAALASAQSTTTAQPPASSAAQTTADSITVTGCLRSASTAPDISAATGTTGTAGSTATTTAGAGADQSQPQRFVLVDATRGNADPANATTAEPDVAASQPKKETYRLIANPTVLAQQVGKRLELTGTLEPPNAASTDTTSDPFAGRPTLRVMSGKIVGAKCDQ